MGFGPFSRQLPRITEGATAGLYQAGNRILSRAEELIPVDTGTAKSSGRTLLPEVKGDGVEVIVGFGYGDKPNPKTGEPAIGYIIPLHERVDVHHPHGQAKFLETAALEEIPALAADVAVTITRARKDRLGVLTGTLGGVFYTTETLGAE